LLYVFFDTIDIAGHSRRRRGPRGAQFMPSRHES
jgi:hypothetical protein